MPLKTYLRKIMPAGFWQTLGFLQRAQIYWSLDRSSHLCVKNGLRENNLFWNEEVCVTVPEDLTAYIFWRSHGFEEKGARQEVGDFLALTEECSALVDIGAHTGFMSALFARSRSGAYKIQSVEPDPQALPILKRAVELNNSSQGCWEITTVAVADVTQTITLPVNVNLLKAGQSARPETMKVQGLSLADLVASLGWVPDVLKIDVESYEHEILTSSFGVMEDLKPKLQLEVHWEILAARGKSAFDFLGPLADMGYRGLRKNHRDMRSWERVGKSDRVSRLSLYAD